MKRIIQRNRSALVALVALVSLVAMTLSTFVVAQTPKPQPREPKAASGKNSETPPEDRSKKTETDPAKPDAKAPAGERQKPVTESEKKKPDEKEPGRVRQKPVTEGEKKKPDEKEPGKERQKPVTEGEKKNPKDTASEKGKPVPVDPKKEPTDGKRPDRTPGKEVPKVSEKTPIEGLPKDFDDQQRQAYRRIEHQDLSFEEYLRLAKLEFGRRRQLEKNPSLRYQPGRRGRSTPNTACGDGDFESLVDPMNLNAVNPGEWSGGYGVVLPTGVPDYANFTAALISGPINTSTARQTIVSAGTDPNVPIQMTGPNTFIAPYNSSPISPNAVRIGNSVNGAGAELLSKTFTVTPSDTLIRFWYAVVLENPILKPPFPPHTLIQQPAFQVRVLDNSTTTPTEVVGVVDLGNGTAKLVADTVNNPFFKVQNRPAQPDVPIAYTDWQCAQIKLSTLVGKSVTVEFVTQDCTLGGHWGYAYVDDFCGTCDGNPTGEIAFDPDMSTKCGKGQVCFKYTLPTAQNAAGNITGTAVITLGIYQNGTLIQTLPTNPATLSSGANVCFAIDPATIPGLSTSSGFDLVANGIFTLGGFNLPLSVGTAPDGRIPGLNNDYNDPRDCGPGTPVACGCCLGENLVKNGDFEHPGEIHSEYELANGFDSLFPGTYSVNHVDKIGKFCSNWKLPKACDGTKNFYENVLIVNGLTNQPAGSTSVIWSQQITLPSNAGLKGADYRLCFRYLPLPQCCFDIQAKPIVLINDGRIPLTDVCDEDTACGHLFAATFHGAGTINLQIVLPEDGKGDGNDLLIDNISVAQLTKVPFAVVDFTLNAGALTGSTKDITLTATSTSLTSPPYTWVWEMWVPGATTPTTSIVGGNIATFPGLASTPTDYIFKLKAKSDCNTLGGSLQGWHFLLNDPNAVRAKAKTVEDPNPEPVDFMALMAIKGANNKKGPSAPIKRSE